MARRLLELEDSTGEVFRGESIGAWEDFDVSSPTFNFVTTKPISTSSRLRVYTNGLLMREGASHDYVRNTSLSRIEFNSARQQNDWVRVEWV